MKHNLPICLSISDVRHDFILVLGVVTLLHLVFLRVQICKIEFVLVIFYFVFYLF